jgi:hypothetical protein
MAGRLDERKGECMACDARSSLALMRESQNVAIVDGCWLTVRVEERKRLLHGSIDESALPRHCIWAQELPSKHSSELPDPIAHIGLGDERLVSLPAAFHGTSSPPEHGEEYPSTPLELVEGCSLERCILAVSANLLSYGIKIFSFRVFTSRQVLMRSSLELHHCLTSSVNSDALSDMLYSLLQSLTQTSSSGL